MNCHSTQQRLLNQFKTPARSARGPTGITEYKPELVPKGYGEMIKNESGSYGIDPAIIAGLIETESAWNLLMLSVKLVLKV